MKERNKQFTWISVLLAVLGISNIIGSIYSLTVPDVYILIKSASAVSVLAVLTALFYGLKGYKKNAAVVYKIYMILFAVILWLGIINRGLYLEHISSAVTIGCMSIQFACIAILIVAENLGQKKSMVLCWIVLIMTIIAFVTMFFAFPGVLRGGSAAGNVVAIRTGSNVLLSGIALLLTRAKYKDKGIRGTK